MNEITDFNNLCMGCMCPTTVDGVCKSCGFDENTYSSSSQHLPLKSILAGKYMIGRVLGEGGFGITYIGLDLNLDMKVAVKEYYPNGFVSRDTTTSTVTPFFGEPSEIFTKGKSKFIDEAKSLAKFRNLAGIVAVNDFFLENGTAYIVMEYVDGQTLKSYLASQKLSSNQVFDMMLPVMQSLAYVHQSGMIHRDISPDNIMITRDGAVKLLDFGAARDFADSGNKSLSVLLKLGYAPPEQYSSKGQQGPWTDVYALCATIYKIITGITPDESIDRLQNDQLKPPSKLGLSINPAQEQALLKGMSVSKGNRFQTIAQLMEALYPQMKAQAAAVHTPPMPASKPQAVPRQGAPAALPQRVTPEGKKSSVGLIVGICVGAAVLLAVLIAAVLPKESVGSRPAIGQMTSQNRIELYEDELNWLNTFSFELIDFLNSDFDVEEYDLVDLIYDARLDSPFDLLGVIDADGTGYLDDRTEVDFLNTDVYRRTMEGQVYVANSVVLPHGSQEYDVYALPLLEGDTMQGVLFGAKLLMVEGLSQPGNTAGNLANYGRMVLQDEDLYYSDSMGTYKSNPDGSGGQKLVDDVAFFINVTDGWVYYIEGNSDFIFKMRTDGSEQTQLNVERSAFMTVSDGWIYYCMLESDSINGKLCRMRTDGSDQTILLETKNNRYLNVVDNSLYFTNDAGNYKMNTDGTDIEQLTQSDGAMNTQYYDGYLYYNIGDGSLYRTAVDGFNAYERIGDEYVTYFNVADGWIYYGDQNDRNLYKMRMDGTGVEKLADQPTYTINVAGELILFVGDSFEKHYTVHTDGTGLSMLIGGMIGMSTPEAKPTATPKPIATLKPGYIPGIGLNMEPLTERQKSSNKINSGVIVTKVLDGFTAIIAGVQKDDIISHIDDTPVSSVDEFRAAIAKAGFGATVELKVIRKGKNMTIDVVVSQIKE